LIFWPKGDVLAEIERFVAEMVPALRAQT